MGGKKTLQKMLKIGIKIIFDWDEQISTTDMSRDLKFGGAWSF
jgi:hypothetical protein